MATTPHKCLSLQKHKLKPFQHHKKAEELLALIRNETQQQSHNTREKERRSLMRQLEMLSVPITPSQPGRNHRKNILLPAEEGNSSKLLKMVVELIFYFKDLYKVFSSTKKTEMTWTATSQKHSVTAAVTGTQLSCLRQRRQCENDLECWLNDGVCYTELNIVWFMHRVFLKR